MAVYEVVVLLTILLTLGCSCSSGLSSPATHAAPGLKVGFYKKSCPLAETVVRAVVANRFRSDPSITPALLRMHFHDCFVTGCDASILIDSTAQRPSERAAVPNLTVRGFDLIQQAKSKLESICASTVSCADIIALATRDAVALAGGPRYAVPTGRRDGLVSLASAVFLPGPSIPLHDAVTAFASRGLSLTDMVVLLGSHTVGVAHCHFFRDRLHNFRGTGSPDPSMDQTLRAKLARACEGAGDPTVFLDQNTSFLLDNRYYREIIARKGVMLIDQELAMDKKASKIVQSLERDGALFAKKFAGAMVKMGKIGVLVGNKGEIRRKCNVFNSPHR